MANWNGLQLTNKGIALQAKVQAGTELEITKLKLGSGVVPSGTDIKTLTDLITPEQNLGIGRTEAVGDYCKVSATISNSGLEAGYYVRELGVFAQDPDDGEILYMYTTDGAPDYLPAGGGSTVISQEFNVMIAVNDTDNVSVEIASDTLATMGYVLLQIQQHDANAGAHEAAFNAHNAADDAHKDFTGATSGVAGKRGMVPAPAAGTANRYLKADGTWGTIDTMNGASSSAAGSAGLVPAPTAGDQNKALFGDATYKQVVQKVNGVAPDSAGNVTVPIYTNANQIGLNDRTFTWEQLYDALPNNSMLVCSVNPSSASPLYNPNLDLPNAGTLNVVKGSGSGYGMQIILIPASVSNSLNINWATFANETFSGWKQMATTDILPVGTILPFSGDTIPAGWLGTNGAAINRTTYSRLFGVIGTKYGAGDGSTTFNLPLLEDNRFLEFASTAGTKKNAGLPNITGQLDTGGDTPLFYAERITGAFSPNGSTNLNFGAADGSVATADRCYQVSFDASRSSTVYGDSTTVQPKSLTVRAIIKY